MIVELYVLLLIIDFFLFFDLLAKFQYLDLKHHLDKYQNKDHYLNINFSFFKTMNLLSDLFKFFDTYFVYTM